MQIELPISKSIANRLLILQAIHGDGLMTVSCDMPDDVRIMSEAIRLLGERRELTLATAVQLCASSPPIVLS